VCEGGFGWEGIGVGWGKGCADLEVYLGVDLNLFIKGCYVHSRSTRCGEFEVICSHLREYQDVTRNGGARGLGWVLVDSLKDFVFEILPHALICSSYGRRVFWYILRRVAERVKTDAQWRQ
jgi:hypothetical protein